MKEKIFSDLSNAFFPHGIDDGGNLDLLSGHRSQIHRTLACKAVIFKRSSDRGGGGNSHVTEVIGFPKSIKHEKILRKVHTSGFPGGENSGTETVDLQPGTQYIEHRTHSLFTHGNESQSQFYPPDGMTCP